MESLPPASDDAPAIGRRIRDLRRAQRLAAKRLAAELGVSRTALHKWESGANCPRPAVLRALAGRLGVTPEFLRSGPPAADPLGQANRVAGILDQARRELASASGLPIDAVMLRMELLPIAYLVAARG
ncbi:helix-turn-helix domain-containing protein [Allosphingosinicella indica]|uniref:Transcriptional regulator, contains XRE-family HTH domain n=1 Tax=Allosphingosinicella indica TaxID=941907 RepID=A0A1X7FZN5_9SPHN|nr:helix-turn-helix transcriptional regulator [Allosphingosinicella indica]SMF61551.1 Transcriptional regulator, contains XRE-family HTH domain [Allosphingosinicella indica]